MGVHNLMSFVKNACRQGNVTEFSGYSVAVDVSCLLCKSLFGYVGSKAQGLKANFCVKYVDKHVQVLLNLGCHVILVFDGRPLPAKKDTKESRRKRYANRFKAGELLAEGEANETMGNCDRTPTSISDIVESAIHHFRAYTNVDVVVSPYESDAQLAFLANEHFADVVITEDTDLIVFGCEKVAFKWNRKRGDCLIYEKCHLPRCFTGIMSSQFDFIKFRRICILSGCDYLQLLPRIPTYLNMSKLSVSKDFIEDFIRAENTFLYQVVFDPRKRCQRPLTPYPQNDNNQETDQGDLVKSSGGFSNDNYFSQAGEIVPSELAVRLALGNQVHQSEGTDKFCLPPIVPEWSIWHESFENSGNRKRHLEEGKGEKEGCGANFQVHSVAKKRKAETQVACLISSATTTSLEVSSERSSHAVQ